MKSIFKILITALFLFASAQAKEIKFIHITDIELNTNNAYQLQKTIKEANSFKDIDFVVFGGNNISKTKIDNLNTFLYLLKKVNKKAYVLLGSSDVLSSSGINKEYYLKRVRRALWFKHSAKPNYVFKKKDIVFVAMDGSKEFFQSTNGYYTKTEINWLKKILEKNKDKKVVILQHFPLLETNSQWLQTVKTEEYYELLKQYKNVKVIVSGHYGDNLEVKKDNIYHIITESYSKNKAYKIIELDLDNDFIGTYLVKD